MTKNKSVYALVSLLSFLFSFTKGYVGTTTLSPRSSVRMCAPGSCSSKPSNPSDNKMEGIRELTSASSLALGAGVILSGAGSSSAAEDQSILPSPYVKTTAGLAHLGEDAYVALGTTKTCRILNGMWQVSGAHGYEPKVDSAVSEMSRFAEAGFSTFDLADIYGPAEGYVGSFKKGRLSSPLQRDCQFFTKWVPRPGLVTKPSEARAITEDAIGRSLRRMETEQLDLVQFHWWEYENKCYFDCMSELMRLKDMGQIRNIGLTNIDTKRMMQLLDQGAPIVSNQVSYSIIDTRPSELMAPAMLSAGEDGPRLLCYGALVGGFLSNHWLNKPEPSKEDLANVSLRKYLPWIVAWGGWGLFQELLRVLADIGHKHHASISNIAVRWVLDRPAVAGAIVGARLGYREHIADNAKVSSSSRLTGTL
jgi:aryl-alcohol dehydrogenase-like predicted oxidoreductase